MPKLIVTTEAQGKISYDFTEDLITIGRAPDNMIIVEDPSVSGHHAELRIVNGKHQLKDIGSTNGTIVNGNTITETQLGHGDRIRFGGVDARYEAVDPTATQPLPRVQEIMTQPAEASTAPVDFANASPFPRRSKQKDPTRTAFLAVAAIALLAFLGSVVAVLTMHAPAL
jgi:pSer/pThr/pTyr-binding forkhead associated (FHA) protein